MNEVIKNIESRQSCRNYREEQITDEERDYIVNAGRFAATGKNKRLNHFIVIQNKEILDELKEIVNEDFFYNSPTFIIVANNKDNDNALPDAGCSLQNMMLAATSLGIGTCWINKLRRLDGIKEIRQFVEKLGLGKDEIITGGLSVGYPAVELNRGPVHSGNKVTFFL